LELQHYQNGGDNTLGLGAQPSCCVHKLAIELQPWFFEQRTHFLDQSPAKEKLQTAGDDDEGLTSKTKTHSFERHEVSANHAVRSKMMSQWRRYHLRGQDVDVTGDVCVCIHVFPGSAYVCVCVCVYACAFVNLQNSRPYKISRQWHVGMYGFKT
jgi:hypothetical protein